MDSVNSRVTSELELIPRGTFQQNMFRALYQMHRLNALGPKPEHLLSAQGAVDRAAAMVRADDPAFVPQYDPALTAG